MYVGLFAGKRGKQSAASVANVLYCAVDEFTEVNIKCVRNFQQRLQARSAAVVLKKAHARLGQVGINCKLCHGGFLLLPLLGKEFGDSAADFIVVIVL